jgi:hypothetical protein
MQLNRHTSDWSSPEHAMRQEHRWFPVVAHWFCIAQDIKMTIVRAPRAKWSFLGQAIVW